MGSVKNSCYFWLIFLKCTKRTVYINVSYTIEMKICRIENTVKSDLEFIYEMFDKAINYQKKNNFPVWPDYDKNTLRNDIEQMLQFKIIIEGSIACVFSICFEDKIVWRERDKNDAVYLHRIVVNQNFKGLKLFRRVLEWAKNISTEKEFDFIRMDTWADNPSIIEYYHGFGFKTVDLYTTPNSEDLPIQQRNNEIVLLQYEN